MRLVIGAPGNGTVLKDAIKERLAVDRRVNSVVDLSAPGITYPEVSFRAGRAIAEGEADRGILICGTGVGTAIAAGKVPGVRAALVWSVETARLARAHNDANVAGFGVRQHSAGEAVEILDAFLAEPFSADARHQQRIDQVSAYERARPRA